MPAPDWVSYLGAVTGLAGSVMGFISLRRSTTMKALDLRLELRKAEVDLLSLFRSLQPLLERAKLSRDRVNAARGMLRSGAATAFECGFNRSTQQLC